MRIFLQYVIPLVLPMAVYFSVMFYLRHRAGARGDEVPSIEHSHVFWSLLLGFALMIAGLAYIAATSGVAPGSGEYQSPRLENGKIVPPMFD